MSSKSATLKDLQKECKALQLSTAGKKADLIQRLQDNAKNRGVSSAAQEASDIESDAKCDAILVARSEIGGEEETKRDVKDALGKALQEEEHHVKDVRGGLFVGNRRGLSLTGLPERVCILEQEIDLHKDKIVSLETKNVSLEDRVSSLTSSLNAYKLLRNRFISTFKRGKLGNATEADRRIIGTGNIWAHGGDAVVDAQFYQGMDSRRDAKAFKKLYGFLPETVQRINHQPTIDVLNTHAKIAASKHETGSDKFYTLFAEFVELFEDSDFDEGYLDGNPTDVTRAYWAFLNSIRDEVTRVEASD